MVLVFHHGALGDWVLVWPVLRALGLRSDAGLVLVAGRSKARLAASVLGLGGVPIQARDIDEPRWSRLFGPGAADEADDDVRRTLGAAELVVSFVSDGADVWAGNVRALAPRAGLACVGPSAPQAWPGHVSEWHRHELSRQGIHLQQVEVALRATPDGPVVVHPGSGSRDKCWPADRFAEVVAGLRREGASVVPILGEVELERWPAELVAEWLAGHGARVLTTLDDLAHMLLSARAWLGNDSGPTHLAAQLGLPTLALFGPTDPRRWRPLGPAVEILAPPAPCDMTWLGVAAVRAALGRVLGVKG